MLKVLLRVRTIGDEAMNRIAVELDEKLQTLDDERAAELTRRVKAVIDAVDVRSKIDPMLGVENGYPIGYFAETAGALAGEEFEREPQGELPKRDDW